MGRKSLASIILLISLVSCNLITPTSGSSPSAPTSPVEAESQATQFSGETSPTPIGGQPGGTGEVTSTPNVIVPIPSSSVQIEGVQYTAYQIPGDPFRFVCPEPCPLDLQYIYAEYAGFRLAHAKLIELTGIDTLVELQPVDMHLVLNDSICSPAPYGHAYVYGSVHQAYTCTDGPGYYPTPEELIQHAARLEDQYFTLHEYMHTFFFGRISGKAGSFEDAKATFFHDFVVPVPSYVTGDLDPNAFCTYRNPLAPGDYGGWLILELCQQDGFQLKDLSASLQALDQLYQSGGGQVNVPGYQHPSPTVAQYRDILNNLLGKDTTGAFAAACWPPQLFGNSYTPPPACVVATAEGTPTPLK